MAESICSVDGCSKRVQARGWCDMHYTRWHKHGDPRVAREPYDQRLKRRFEKKVDKDGPVPSHCPNLGPCWVWTAALKGAYGAFRATRGGGMQRAHRVAYALSFGSVPDDLWVLHRCDNKLCVNPAHLFLGTRQDNVDDMMRKGRNFVTAGTRNGNAKLTEDDVVVIRALQAESPRPTDAALGLRFGVSGALIREIRVGTRWTHVAALNTGIAPRQLGSGSGA